MQVGGNVNAIFHKHLVLLGFLIYHRGVSFRIEPGHLQVLRMSSLSTDWYLLLQTSFLRRATTV